MGKSSRAHNARLAELRASQAREERRRRLLLAGAVVAVVLLVAGGLVAVALQGSNNSTSTNASGAKRPVPLDQATFTKLTTVPASALDAVGVGTSSNPPKTIDAPALTRDGKPRVVYVGAEYCPFCASERWPRRRGAFPVRHMEQPAGGLVGASPGDQPGHADGDLPRRDLHQPVPVLHRVRDGDERDVQRPVQTARHARCRGPGPLRQVRVAALRRRAQQGCHPVDEPRRARRSSRVPSGTPSRSWTRPKRRSPTRCRTRAPRPRRASTAAPTC